jgi:adenine-specific DNA methylase
MAVSAPPRTWPARYRLHKYWSRKPADVVRGLVERHTEPGDLVLDPFCGSGVAVVEAALAGRPALGLDANPFAVALADATLARVDPEALRARGEAVLAVAEAEEACWHVTACRRCGAEVRLAGTARIGGDVVAVLVRCQACGGTAREPPNRADQALERMAQAAGDGGAPRPTVFPGWQTRKLVRAGLADFGELFTPRNLRALAALRRAILAGEPGVERDLLLLALTGALAQASRMMADHTAAGGGASWKINIYWLPARSLELDPFRAFANRLARVVAAKRETEAGLAEAGGVAARVVRADARDLLDHLPAASAPYVFADPPYGGEGIQYAELSALWCAWLEPAVAPDLAVEIGVNPVQGRGWNEYAAGLGAAFGAIREAIAPDGVLTVTFASREPAAWRALAGALAAARFRVELDERRPRSAPGLTERTSPGATRDDAWLRCRPA